MTTDRDHPNFPPKAAALLHSIDTGAVLGASRQLNVLGEVLLDVADVRAGDSEAMTADVLALVHHVKRTRGASSQAVLNGVDRMAAAILNPPRTEITRESGDRLVSSVRAFTHDLDEWLAVLRKHGQRLLRTSRTVLAYDYSSTVAQVLADLSVTDDGLTVFVAEARSLDGGHKYLADWSDRSMNVRLIPDAAVGWALRHCDAAVAGAETLSSEGGCYNTIGTAIVAHEASRIGVPFYVLSVLLKTDLTTLGAERPSPSLNFLGLTQTVAPHGGAMSVQGGFPDLDYTDPASITSVVTECGAVPPHQVRELASSVLGPHADVDD